MRSSAEKRAARWQAIRVAQDTLEARPVFVDTETTGLGERDQIIEVAVVNVEGELLLESLIQPKVRVAPDAVAVHGITNEMVAEAPRWSEIWPELETLLSDRDLAIYNADFDLRLMQQTHRIHDLPWRLKPAGVLCVMRLYARFFGQWDRMRGGFRWQSLEDAREQCGIDLPNTHRARDDALLTLELLRHIAASRP
jgi:DNA polymerase III epsilon subunit-like protein